jgi:DNA replication protein DnaC
MTAIEVDTTRLPLLLHDLRLPAIARLWPDFAERADKEGWPAARLLSVLAELEVAERGRRRVERPLIEARLPAGKTSTTSTSRRADAQQGTRGRRPEPHPDQGAAFNTLARLAARKRDRGYRDRSG